jgi:alpha-galactosidase
LSDADYRTHFGLWAMMAAPLIAGNDLRSMDAATLAILTNAEVIAVDQDPGGVPGRRLTHLLGPEVWARPLTLDGARAVLLYNDYFFAETATVDWDELGLAPGSATVRDVWAQGDLGAFTNSYSTKLEPFASTMLLVQGVEHQPPAGESALGDLPWEYSSSYLRDVERNASLGGNPLTIAGVKYASGLGAAAASQILFHLGARCSRFTAAVGIDDETNGSGTVVFQVWADGAKLYDSGAVKGGQAARNVQVDLTGRRELKLMVEPADDNVYPDHADWANARLTCS